METKQKQETKKCCICGKEFKGWGNNPSPVKDHGTCCDDCNRDYVIPCRLLTLIK